MGKIRELCGRKVEILGAFAKLQKTDQQLRHICRSIRKSTWKNLAPAGRIFMKFDFEDFFSSKNLSR